MITMRPRQRGLGGSCLGLIVGISKDVVQFGRLPRYEESEAYSTDYESLIVIGYTVCCHYLYMLSVDT
jgi:hypothetical protein